MAKEDGNINSKKKDASPASVSGSADGSGLRRSARETPSKKQATSNPSNARRSERIEKHTSPSSSPIKKKPDRNEEQMGPSPLRRSDRSKKNISSDSSGSNIKSKKEIIASSSKQGAGDVSVDNKNKRDYPNLGGMKRKRMTARGYQALFKPQKLLEADVLQEPDPQHMSPQVNTSSNKDVDKALKSPDKVPVHDNKKSGCLSEDKDDGVGGAPCSSSKNLDVEEVDDQFVAGESNCKQKISFAGGHEVSPNSRTVQEASDKAQNMLKVSFAEGHEVSPNSRTVQEASDKAQNTLKISFAEGHEASPNSRTVQESSDKAQNTLLDEKQTDLDQAEHVGCPSLTKPQDGRCTESAHEVSPNSRTVQEASDKAQNTLLDEKQTDLDQVEHVGCPSLTKPQDGSDIHISAKSPSSRCKKHGADETCLACSKEQREVELSGSKFVEYWVPVQISNLQLEQYCATLLSGAMALRSNTKTDTVGALHDILNTNRKCCNHPYCVDGVLQGSLTNGQPLDTILDIGFKASGKVHFLQLLLPELRKRQLRVVILFQSTVRTPHKELYIGNILDDLVRQSGEDSYDRVDGEIVPAEKQSAVNNFNNKEMDKFIFLLDTRACNPIIKLSSIDIIIIYDSNLNPANDIKSLQKLSIDSQSEQITILRLYSSSTLEEKILKLSEQNVAVDSKLQNLNRITCDALLMWGASDLFKKLNDFHESRNSNISSEETFLKKVMEEFLNLVSQKCDMKNSLITKIQKCGNYGNKSETKTVSPDGEQPHIFWRNLLEGKHPKWKFITESTSRQRKRPQYFGDSIKEANPPVADVGKKRKKSPASKAVIEWEGVNEGHNESQSSSGSHFWSIAASNAKSLPELLKPTVRDLCRIFKFPAEIKTTVENFLDFVLEKYNVGKEHERTLPALMISVCWIGASLSEHTIDMKKTFALATKQLSFTCMEEEANSVFIKLESVKEAFLEHIKIQEKGDVSEDGKPTPVDQKVDVSESQNESIEKGNEEIEKFNREWDEKRENLLNDHKVDIALIRNLYTNPSKRSESLETLEKDFANKLEEHERMKAAHLKILKDTLSAGEGQMAAHNGTLIEGGGDEVTKMPLELDGARIEDKPREGGSLGILDATMEPPNGVGDSGDGGNDIESTGSQSMVDADVAGADASLSGLVIEEIPPQQADETGIENNVDSMELGVPEVDSNQENADMAPCVESGEMGVPGGSINPIEEQNDSCGSSSSNQPSTAVSQDKTPSVQLDHPMPTILEIQDKEGQADPISLAQIDGDNLQPVDEGQIGQINPESPSLVPHDDPTAQNQSDEGQIGQINSEEATLAPRDDPTGQNESDIATNEEPTPTCGANDEGQIGQINPESPSLVPHDDPTSQNQSDEGQIGQINSEEATLVPRDDPTGQNESDIATNEEPTPTCGANDENAPEAAPAPAPPELNTFDFQGSGIHNQMLSQMTNQSDPLQMEIWRLCAYKEKLIKFQEDKKQKIESEREKEIAEMIVRINLKYEAKIKETDSDFLIKKKELDINLNRVANNRFLAEAFRSKCKDLTHSGNAGMQQVPSAGLLQQAHRFRASSSAGQSSGHQTMRPSPPPPPPQPPLPPPQRPLQIVHQPAALFSNTPSRPPVPNTNSRLSPVINPNSHRPPPGGSSSSPVTPSITMTRLPPGSSPVTPTTMTRPPPGSSPLASSTTMTRPLPPGGSPITPSTMLNKPPPSINQITPSAGSLRINSDIRAPAPHMRPSVSNEIRAPAPHMRPSVSNEIRAPAPHIRPFRPSTSAPPRVLPPVVAPLPPLPTEPHTVPPPPLPTEPYIPPPPPPLQPSSPPPPEQNPPSSLPLPPIPASETGGGPPPLPDITLDFDIVDLTGFMEGDNAQPSLGGDVVCLSDDD